MIFDIYRMSGNAKFTDDFGKIVLGYETIEKVGQVQAASAEQAMHKARSTKDPSPILQRVDA